MLTLLVACHSDVNLNGKDAEPPFSDSGGRTPVDTGDPPPEEVCNGVDDDGDGEIDEGFPDDDGNGRVDCLDATCPPLVVGEAGAVAVDDTCGGTLTPVDDPWSVRTKWTFAAPASSPGDNSAYVLPVIGNLDDDDGDGAITVADTPDVVTVTMQSYYGTLVVLDGATGAEKWAWGGAEPTSGAAIADVDGDGAPEVLVFDMDYHLVALSGDGTIEWTATDTPSAAFSPLVTVADLEGDGTVEVLADDLVLEGATGASRFSLGVSSSVWGRMPAVADADQDGDQEIFMAGNAYDSDGTLLWSTGSAGRYGSWVAVVNADGDDEGELLFLTDTVSLRDPDGVEIAAWSYSSDPQPGPPCIGDLDGDGDAELAFPSDMTLSAFELDGTEMWSRDTVDYTGLAGCSAWDLDGDGALEVLYAGMEDLQVFDGATGATRFSETDHASQTVLEYPTVADLDHDGHGEIVVVSAGAPWGNVVALEHDGAGWSPAGPTWATHDFSMGNVGADGRVPTDPAGWLDTNVYRARVAADDLSAADLRVELTDVCVADCDYGPAALAFQVSNAGTADVPAGVEVAVYAQDDTARRVAAVTLSAVPAGARIEGLEVELSPGDVGAYGLRVVVDEPGAVDECDETNNRVSDTVHVCP